MYEFIELIKNATLEDSGLTERQVHRLRNPPEKPFEIKDKDTLLSIKLFLACGNASQETYNAVCDAIKEHSPDIQVLSLAQVGVFHHCHELISYSCRSTRLSRS